MLRGRWIVSLLAATFCDGVVGTAKDRVLTLKY